VCGEQEQRVHNFPEEMASVHLTAEVDNHTCMHSIMHMPGSSMQRSGDSLRSSAPLLYSAVAAQLYMYSNATALCIAGQPPSLTAACWTLNGAWLRSTLVLHLPGHAAPCKGRASAAQQVQVHYCL
jgi:hypothetical protein